MKQGVPPESAEEYLLRVRIESSDLPAVVEAHVPDVLKKKQTLYMPSTEPVPACPEYLLPSEEWEREVLSTFVDLRQYMRRWKATAAVSPAEREPVPALKDSTGWHIFCLGYADQEEDDDEDVVESAAAATHPAPPGLRHHQHVRSGRERRWRVEGSPEGRRRPERLQHRTRREQRHVRHVLGHPREGSRRGGKGAR
ncbi:unnamed protein product [Ectocarpus fasciculatus]